MTDPYKVLGVPTTATDDEVKAAYRRLAKKYHPDANPGDKVAEQRMKEINAAYDQIMNKTASGANQGYGGYSSGGYAGYDPFGRNMAATAQQATLSFRPHTITLPSAAITRRSTCSAA